MKAVHMWLSRMMEDFVHFMCVKVGPKLRVRIVTKGYQNEANCQFPRAIREEGKHYKAPVSAVTLAKGPAGKYFYRVKRNLIEVIETPTVLPEKIFRAEDCVICLDSLSEIILVPCGHFCLCKGCTKVLKDKSMTCPMCRSEISHTITEDQIQT